MFIFFLQDDLTDELRRVAEQLDTLKSAAGHARDVHDPIFPQLVQQIEVLSVKYSALVQEQQHAHAQGNGNNNNGGRSAARRR